MVHQYFTLSIQKIGGIPDSQMHPQISNDDWLHTVSWYHIHLFSQETYPLVICYMATENGLVEIVSFPMKHGDFSIAMLVITRG